MNCFYCKGVDTVEEQPTRFCACESPQPFVVENVPAAVCRLCGDKSFSAETVAVLEKIKNGEAQARGYQVIQIFDFEQPGRAGEPGIVGSHHQTPFDYYVDPSSDQNSVTLYRSTPSWTPGVVYPMAMPKSEKPLMQYISDMKPGDAWQHDNVAIGEYFVGTWDQDRGVVGIVRQHSNDSPSHL